MDTATAIATARKVAKMADKVIKYIKADNEAAYGLDEEVTVLLEGEDVASIGGTLTQLTEYTTKDGSLTVETPSAFGISLTAHPFPASARLWNGPDVIADNQYRSMLASLFHDLIWGHADELARAWGVSKRDVLTWGNGVLYALWMYASEDSIRGRIEARVAWQVCEFSRGWYHSLKKILGLHCLAFALLLAGCGTPPDWTVAEISGTNAIHRAMGRVETVAPAAEQSESAQGEEAGTSAQPTEGGESPAPVVDTPSSPASSDAVDFASLNWSWGGFNGKNATSREDADHTICALFCKLDGKWQGGKFDWISTSRLSRDFKNVKDGYGGWRKDAIEAAEAFAFVICSKDGKRRSNVALFSK